MVTRVLWWARASKNESLGEIIKASRASQTPALSFQSLLRSPGTYPSTMLKD